MRSRLLYVFAFLAALPVFAAEPDNPAKPVTSLVVRTGERLHGPTATTYRLVEFSQQRGKWIYPDVGYYDSGHLSDQIWFTGVGGELVHNKRVDYVQVVYVAQEVGRDAHNQREIWIWPVLDLQLTNRLSSETVVYPTIPINRAQRWEFDIDRTKLEYAVHHRLKVGGGYSATIGAESDWFSKPFVTATTFNRSGSWEFWVQRIRGGAQLQVRYTLTHSAE